MAAPLTSVPHNPQHELDFGQMEHFAPRVPPPPPEREGSFGFALLAGVLLSLAMWAGVIWVGYELL